MIGRRLGVCVLVASSVACAKQDAARVAQTSPGDAAPRIVTTPLPVPPNGVGYEPTIAIDPADPDHMIVAAMNGNPPVGKSTGAWLWRTRDGGRTWSVDTFPTPRPPGLRGDANFGADVVADFAADGSAIVASMSGVDTSMAAYLSRLPRELAQATTVQVFANFRDSLKRSVFFDKPWLAVDRVEGSPYRGAVYLSSGALPMERLPEKLGSPWGGPLVAREEIAVSHDDGKTFSKGVTISDSAFAGQMFVGRGGRLDVTYGRIVNMSGSADAIFHRRSTDGGKTFSDQTPVVRMNGDTLLDLPVLAGRPNGDLLSCWSQGVRVRERENVTRCAVRRTEGEWSTPHTVDTTLAPNESSAWPAIVGTADGWFLLQYVVHSTSTDVALYKSADGEAFTKIATLKSAEELGPARFCVTSTTPCRRSRSDGFIIGDYVTLTARGNRLAAAFVLPRHAGGPPDSATVYVSIIDRLGG